MPLLVHRPRNGRNGSHVAYACPLSIPATLAPGKCYIAIYACFAQTKTLATLRFQSSIPIMAAMLPQDVIEHIISFVSSIQDLRSISLTCRTWTSGQMDVFRDRVVRGDGLGLELHRSFVQFSHKLASYVKRLHITTSSTGPTSSITITTVVSILKDLPHVNDLQITEVELQTDPSESPLQSFPALRHLTLTNLLLSMHQNALQSLNVLSLSTHWDSVEIVDISHDAEQVPPSHSLFTSAIQHLKVHNVPHSLAPPRNKTLTRHIRPRAP